ncbi:MAG: hypothetical protein JJU16_11855 [Alkalibacterium sp.]|nr:hypothetical protein [Alkalibacterium sp.]
MKKIAKFTALSLTAGMLLGACGDGEDMEEDFPGVEDPATEGETDDDGMNDDLDNDLDDDVDE